MSIERQFPELEGLTQEQRLVIVQEEIAEMNRCLTPDDYPTYRGWYGALNWYELMCRYERLLRAALRTDV